MTDASCICIRLNNIKYAARHGHRDCLRVLLGALPPGAPETSSAHTSALILAVSNGHIECCKLLLDMPSVDVNARGYTGQAALTYAVRNKQYECCKLLLSVPSIDVNAKNQRSQTALMMGARFGAYECCKLLLRVPSIDVNTGDENGQTALMSSVLGKHYECCRLLLNLPSIDVNATDAYGRTALMYAVTWPGWPMNEFPAIAELLLEADSIAVNAQDNRGKTALMLAACLGNRPACRRLLRKPSVDANVTDRWGRTALHVGDYDDDVVRILLPATSTRNLVGVKSRVAVAELNQRLRWGALQPDLSTDKRTATRQSITACLVLASQRGSGAATLRVVGVKPHPLQAWADRSNARHAKYGVPPLMRDELVRALCARVFPLSFFRAPLRWCHQLTDVLMCTRRLIRRMPLFARRARAQRRRSRFKTRAP